MSLQPKRSLRVIGKRRIATVPIYRASKIVIDGKDVTPRVRGLYDGKRIVLTRYALRGKTAHHEIAHSIDDLRHGHIVESHAREIGFSRPKKIGVIGFSKRSFTRAELKKILNDDTRRVEEIFRREIRKPHPRNCQCPYHGGHKRARAPAEKGIGRATGYSMTGKTGFMDGPIRGL